MLVFTGWAGCQRYCRPGTALPVYPEPVLSTDEMGLSRSVTLRLDGCFRGWAETEHARNLGL